MGGDQLKRFDHPAAAWPMQPTVRTPMQRAELFSAESRCTSVGMTEGPDRATAPATHHGWKPSVHRKSLNIAGAVPAADDATLPSDAAA